MKIRYLNGNRLYHAFVAGGEAVIRDQALLNKINVFPVPDADTGTNLASTMRAIALGARAHPSIRETLRSIANAAITGAQGNSGIIFAQFLHGLSREVGIESKLTTRAFAESVRKAVHYAHQAIVHPVEGTMITVIRDWAESVYQKRDQTSDFDEMMTASLDVARRSLSETPQKLEVLARAGVVDAGAKGFVDFLEGILHFIKKGALARYRTEEIVWTPEEVTTPPRDKTLRFRYCSEALLTGKALDPEAVRTVVSRYGDSAAVAGSDERVRVHVHTDDPPGLFTELQKAGTIAQIKVDDMRKQYEAAWAPKSRVAIVTDSACDLPPAMFDDRQIFVLPMTLSFGGTLFLDKVTITPSRFYRLLAGGKVHPKSSQPPMKTVENLLSYLASHYDSIIVLTISDKLSGVRRMCVETARRLRGTKISVIDSRSLSAGLGLLVARASELAVAGVSHDEIVRRIEAAVPRTRIFVDVQTLKYMVRGGRVSRLKGLLAKVLNIKPIVTLDAEGKAAAAGKSFSRKSNMAKILAIVEDLDRAEGIGEYAVVHAWNPDRASAYAGRLTARLGRPPAYIEDVAPVIGVHNGIGAVAVCLISK